MRQTAADIAQKRGKELFLVETIRTPKGRKYAVVSHREKIGQDKRIIEMFDHTPAERERATRIAKQFREATKNAYQTN